MNTRPAIESSRNPAALSASFNDNASCFAIGLDTGFRIYNSDPIQIRRTRDFNAGIGAAEMLGRTNFIALVGGGKQPKYAQNRVVVWDDSKNRIAAQIPVLTTVRGVRITRTHIVVALLNTIQVYHFHSQPKLWGSFETTNNPYGLCCLSSKTVVFPGRSPGHVQVVELDTGNVTIIPAHTSPLRAIDISRDGEVLASASTKGTLIRVYSTSNCAKIAELRRGLDSADIFSISISPSGQLLAVTSDKSTLHIFDIPHPSKPPRSDSEIGHQRLTSLGGGGLSPTISEGDPSQKWGVLGRIPLLPRAFSDTYSFTSATFDVGDESTSASSNPSTAGDFGPKPPKGVIGWTSDSSLILLGAGVDGRWERFIVAEGEDGKRKCFRDGWKKYLNMD